MGNKNNSNSPATTRPDGNREKANKKTNPQTNWKEKRESGSFYRDSEQSSPPDLEMDSSKRHTKVETDDERTSSRNQPGAGSERHSDNRENRTEN